MTFVNHNILLTGATGFLGFRTLEKLVDLLGNGKIIAAGRTIKPDAYIEDPRVQYLLGDLVDQEYVASLFESVPIHTVIHCAALASPWGDEKTFYRANVETQKNLIRVSEQVGVKRFVFISTPSLYLDFKDRLNIKESEPLPEVFANEYAKSKYQAEKLLEDSQLAWMALRPRALIGRGDTVIMPRILRAHREKKLKIIGDGKNIVDLTPVSNVVDAIILAMNADSEACKRVYNISNGEPVSLWEAIIYTFTQLDIVPPQKKVPYFLASFMAGLMEFFARHFQGNKEPALTRYTVASLSKSFTMDISLAKQYLGYSPQQSTKEGVDEFIEWYK